MKTWVTPSGDAHAMCVSILQQPHTLIAGSTGSGKSVLINSIIYSAIKCDPNTLAFILIDPKRVELVKYKKLPHTLFYASEPDQIVKVLKIAESIMEDRYKAMQKLQIVETTEQHIYVIIDEFADLMTTQKKDVIIPLCRIAQLGRAAHVHLIIATQRPTRDIITGQIKVNIDSRVALRCPTAQDSRNIINSKGAETLPKYGFGYYLTPDGLQLLPIPFTSLEDINSRVKCWIDQTPRKTRKKLDKLQRKI